MDSVKIAFGTSEDFRKLQDAEPDSDNNSDSSKQDAEKEKDIKVWGYTDHETDK